MPNHTLNSSTWRTSAACVGADVDVFFPVGRGKPLGLDERQAKEICNACPVVTFCRDWAMAVAPEFGIFGGLTADERRSIRIRRTRPARTLTGRRNDASPL